MPLDNLDAAATLAAMRTLLAALAFIVAAGGAQAGDEWGTRALKSCTSVEAQTCSLRPETRICEPNSKACRYIGIDNYVAVRRIMGSRILVDTIDGPATAPLSGLVMSGQ